MSNTLFLVGAASYYCAVLITCPIWGPHAAYFKDRHWKRLFETTAGQCLAVVWLLTDVLAFFVVLGLPLIGLVGGPALSKIAIFGQ